MTGRLSALSLEVPLRRATFMGLSTGHYGRVFFEGEQKEIDCELLCAAEDACCFSPGDAVLVWRPDAEERAVIIGRIGRSIAPEAGPPERAVPDELVLEAKQSLTLRVGDGSITIRADGKILIKGKDLVSHAQRVNRIKGGSVAIN
jgi:hypothetical protein